MGTRADFYVGRGEQAEWLGSIAWDGDPAGIDEPVRRACLEKHYREAVSIFLMRDDATLPAAGWPWPWDDSRTTDYAYAFDGGRVWWSCFGRAWRDALEDDAGEEPVAGGQVAIFPNMKARANVAIGGPQSGLVVL